MITRETLLVRAPDILFANVGEEMMMMSAEAGQYYGLDPVGARMWELLETPQTVGQLCDQIHSEFDVEADVCEADVMKFASLLLENKVVKITAQAP